MHSVHTQNNVHKAQEIKAKKYTCKWGWVEVGIHVHFTCTCTLSNISVCMVCIIELIKNSFSFAVSELYRMVSLLLLLRETTQPRSFIAVFFPTSLST